MTAFFIQIALGAEGEKADGFPDFKLENIEGDDLTAEDAFADADLILIDFFTYYCKPCKKLMAYIDRFQQEYEEQGFKAVLFNEDEPEGIPLTRSYIKQKDFSFEVLFDIDGEIESFYSVSKHPTTILLDAEGNIVHRHEGYNKGDEEALEDFITTFLEELGKTETVDS
jgi:thiol-disulfide isomerase/thioredoxin